MTRPEVGRLRQVLRRSLRQVLRRVLHVPRERKFPMSDKAFAWPSLTQGNPPNLMGDPDQIKFCTQIHVSLFSTCGLLVCLLT